MSVNHDATEFDRNLAVVIGINDYDGENIGKLKTAVEDAKEIGNLLENDYGYEVIRFINEEANLEELKNFFDNSLGDKLKGSPKNRLIFYFAGHGVSLTKDLQKPAEGFLIPQDAKNNDFNTYLSMSEVLKALKKINSHHLLMILDCCYGGMIRLNREFVVETENFYKEHYHHFIEHQAWQFLTSTGYDQVASDSFDISNDKRGTVANSPHSPFAFALIEGLDKNEADENKDAVIESNELYQYVERRMRGLSQNFQTPQIGSLRSEYDKGRFIFTRPSFSVDKLKDAPELNPHNNPYRGLKAFTEKHSDFFFGREKLVKELSDRLSESNPLTIVVGVSGSGKSSFVQAGLIPHLRKEKWEILNPVRPGKFPFTALAKAILPIENVDLVEVIKNKYKVLDNILTTKLKKDYPTFTELVDAWKCATLEAKFLLFIDYSEQLKSLPKNLFLGKEKEDLENLTEKIDKHIKNLGDKLENNHNLLSEIIAKWKKLQSSSKTKLLLVIDQFEELITMSEDSHQEISNRNPQTEKQKLWQKLLKILRQATKEYSEDICIVLTLRSDFNKYFDSLESSQNSDLFSLDEWKEARFPMKLMSSDELQQTIEGPALKQGVFFQPTPKNWVSEIADEVRQMPGGLPLLSFTLSELYIKHFNERLKLNPKDRALKYEDYKALGGVTDSLTRRATQIYNELKSKEEQAIMRRIMLRMVRIEGTETAKRRVPLSELKYPDTQKNQTDNIINYLVDKRLVVRGEERGESYVEPVHDCLITQWQDLKNWITQEQEEIFLRQRLTPDANSWNELTPDAKNNGENTKQKSDEKANIFGNIFGQIESFIIEKFQSIQRKKQRQQIEKNKNDAKNSNGNPIIYLWNNDPRLDELSLVLDSNNNWLNDIEQTFVRQSLIQKGRTIYRSFFGFGGIIAILMLLSLGFFLGSRQAKINEIHRFQESAEAKLKSNSDLEAIKDILKAGKSLKHPLLFFPFQPDENRLAQVRETLSKIIYQTRERNRLQLDTGRIYQVAFHPKEKGLLATVGNGDSVRLWDTNSKEQKQLFSTGQKQEVYSVAFSYDGTRMVTGAGDGTVKLWNINQDNKTVDQSSSKDILDLKKEQQSIRDVEFSPKDDSLLVTVIRDNKGKYTVKLWEPPVGPRDTRVGNTSDDLKFQKSKIILDKNSCDKLNIKEDIYEDIYDVAFSPNGELLAMVRDDARVILWDFNHNKCDLINIPKNQQDKDKVRRVVFVNDNQLATGTEGNKVKLWKIKDGKFDNSEESKIVIGSEEQQGFIRSMAFDINSKQLVTINNQDYVGRLWNSDKNYEEIPDKEIKPLEGNIEGITVKSLAFSDDGNKLATVAGDGTVKLWNLGENQKTTKASEFLTGERNVSSVAFIPGSKEGENELLAIGASDGTISLWNTSSREQVGITKPQQKSVENITFYDRESESTKQKILVATYDDGTVIEIDIDNQKFVRSPDGKLSFRNFKIDLGKVKSLALAPDFKQLATIDEKGKVILWAWDISSSSFKKIPDLKQLPENSQSFDLSFSHDGKRLAVGGENGTITIFNNSGKKLDQFQAKKENINSIAFHPNKNKILAIGGDDGTVRLVDISSNKPDPQVIKDSVQTVSLSEEGNVIAVTGVEQILALYDVRDDGTIELRHKSNSELFQIKPNIAEFNSNKNQLATVETDEERYDIIKLWDISNKESNPIQTIETKQREIDLIAFPSEANLLASRGKEDDGTDDRKTTIKLWEFENNKYQEKSFSNTDFGKFQEKQNIYSVAFSPDGKFIATTTTDNDNVQVWETDGKKYKEFPTQQKDAYVAFSPDGKQLATGGEGGILKLWEIEGNQKERFKTQLRTIYTILFSPDGNKLVITGRSEDSNNNNSKNNNNVINEINVIKLFDLFGNELKQFETPLESESIKRVKFSQDRKRLITITDSGEVRLWQVGDVEKLMELVCGFSKDYLKSSSDKGDRNLCN
ncbi:MAG: caspase family protein [Rivularia sp. (in: cyanobacteria)]